MSEEASAPSTATTIFQRTAYWPIGLYHRCWVDGLTSTDRGKLCASTSTFKLKQINCRKAGDGNSSEDEVEAATR